MAKKTKTDNNDSLQKFKADLRVKNLRQLYLFHGPESFLKEHYLNQARKLLIDGPAEAFNYHRFNAENLSVQALQDAVEAIPMMAEKSMVQIDDVDPYKLEQPDRDALITVLSDIPGFCHVFFVFDTVEYKPDKRLKKLHGLMSESGEVVAFEKQSERELATWIARHFAKYQKNISFDLCRYLILRTGGTMTALHSEIQKIAAYSQGTEVSRDDVDAVVEPVLDAYVFDMTDAVAAGDYEKALLTLRTLFRMQEEPIPLLGAIGTQMRRIYYARQLQSAGKGTDSLMSLCGMGSYPAQKTMEFARRLSDSFCKSALDACVQTDYWLKTSYDDPQRLLELLLLRLAQEARR